jgi:DNA-binding FadR family transcriptional regulator
MCSSGSEPRVRPDPPRVLSRRALPAAATRPLPAATKNAHGHTVDRIGGAIVAGRYAVGGTLPAEPLLCDEFGVSRTVVREAVKSLAAKGLLVAGPKVGTRVLPSDNWNWFDPDVVAWQTQAGLTREFLRDLQELRRVVEPAAVRMAAERATAEDIAGIEAAYEGMRHAVEEGGDYVTHDLRFHQGLLRACHNRMVQQMSKALAALLRTSFEISTSRKDGPRLSLPLHRAVLDAVIARNPAKAEKAILVLIDGARDDIDQVLASHRRLPKLDGPARLLRAHG